MTRELQLILHVGAPKCGSSALQTALSMMPDLVDASGQQLRYTGWRQVGRVGPVLYGRTLSAAAALSAFGYVTWPNVRDSDDVMFKALRRAHLAGLSKGHTPVASNEGWIDKAEIFAPNLEAWGHPPVDVIAYLRPVMEWYNASFWQWGVWNVKSLDAWLHRSKVSYSFGADLEAWSKIPNVRVRFAWAQPDTIAHFAQTYDVGLKSSVQSNISSSPPLIGVLRRHRALRKTGHEAQTEFVVQRWCPKVSGRRLWAVTERHIPIFHKVAQENLKAFKRIATNDEMRRFCEDPRWIEDTKYRAEIAAGVSPMNDPVQLSGLYDSLVEGLTRAETAGGLRPVPRPDCPSLDASVQEWDAVLKGMIEDLLAADKVVRRRESRRIGGPFVSVAERVSALRGHMFKRSR